MFLPKSGNDVVLLNLIKPQKFNDSLCMTEVDRLLLMFKLGVSINDSLGLFEKQLRLLAAKE